MYPALGGYAGLPAYGQPVAYPGYAPYGGYGVVPGYGAAPAGMGAMPRPGYGIGPAGAAVGLPPQMIGVGLAAAPGAPAGDSSKSDPASVVGMSPNLAFNTARVPTLTLRQVADLLAPLTLNDLLSAAQWLNHGQGDAPASLAVVFRGRSQYPGLSDGDVALCARGWPEPGRPALMVLKTREAVPCSWQSRPGGRIALIPLEADTSVREVALDHIAVSYVVTGWVRKQELSGAF
jgi:hypothetical protein